MEKKTSVDYTVLVRDTDFSLRSSLESVGNIFMNAAGLDAERKGFGMDALHKQGLAWVALRIYIKVNSYPAAFEKLQVSTWVENWTKLTTQRDCILSDLDGKTLVEVSSLWAVIDFNSRQPVNLQEALPSYGPWLLDEKLSIRPPEKVRLLTNPELVATRKVVYSDIDSNMHATSFKYVSWILDTVPLEVFQKQFVSDFEINYVKECRYGETVQIFREQIGENVYAYDIRNQENSSLNRCKLTFSNL